MRWGKYLPRTPSEGRIYQSPKTSNRLVPARHTGRNNSFLHTDFLAGLQAPAFLVRLPLSVRARAIPALYLAKRSPCLSRRGSVPLRDQLEGLQHDD